MMTPMTVREAILNRGASLIRKRWGASLIRKRWGTSLIRNRMCEQDDVMMTTMTVREAILFSARLRLPASVSLPDKKDRVDKVLQTLRSRFFFLKRAVTPLQYQPVQIKEVATPL